MLDAVNTSASSIQRYRLLPLPVQIFGLVFCWTLTVIVIGIPHWGARVGGAVIGCLAIAFLFFPETRIDFERGSIVQVGRFLGAWTVWQRQRSKEEFAGIKCYCWRTEDSESPAEWMVELHPRVGRPIYIRQFFGPRGSADCPEARAFARELSQLTGLGLVDECV
jgi:hypothetical protein